MAPKRKNNSGKGSSITMKQHRLTKRVIGTMEPHNKNKSQIATQEKKQLQSKKKQGKKCVANENTENQLDSIMEDTSKDPKSMSVDSNDFNPTDPELSTSGSYCSNTSNTGIQVKTSSTANFHIEDDDDDTDEFQAMFMSNAFASKTRPDYASTPLVRSQHHSQSNMCASAKSLVSRQIKNRTRGPLSTNTVDNQLKMSNTPSRNINTSTNPCTNTDSSPLTQVPNGSQASPSTNYATNNNAILETFVEYRTLKRELQRALNLNERWKADYQILVRRMQRLQNSSFPRPNVDGRAFLEQLLDSIRSSEHDEDNRSSNQLANDIGLPETTLLSFSNAEPQKTALRIFNALFPTNQNKQSLINVTNLNVNHPTLLENILVFARRCSPGSGYSMAMLKEAVGNSIRCARHKIKMEQSRIVAAAAVQQVDPNHENGMMD
ncbi:unnamed protein product [Rotaria sp. Silwood1]|nr:unnamed protein product [Rotaria sp. Silwood1]CAF1433395.1 unnamed protein product [Rotaria sp. Silwood1]CAF1451237.1 unnamed protein product [Rotaria sp. Silwood1]CAF3659275.1 unnamed protein product [Rotaria sp. Silwood1]CAF3673379.1 unnamed protein product [Rotaria sp. Silwood1]